MDGQQAGVALGQRQASLSDGAAGPFSGSPSGPLGLSPRAQPQRQTRDPPPLDRTSGRRFPGAHLGRRSKGATGQGGLGRGGDGPERGSRRRGSRGRRERHVGVDGAEGPSRSSPRTGRGAAPHVAREPPGVLARVHPTDAKTQDPQVRGLFGARSWRRTVPRAPPQVSPTAPRTSFPPRLGAAGRGRDTGVLAAGGAAFVPETRAGRGRGRGGPPRAPRKPLRLADRRLRGGRAPGTPDSVPRTSFLLLPPSEGSCRAAAGRGGGLRWELAAAPGARAVGAEPVRTFAADAGGRGPRGRRCPGGRGGPGSPAGLGAAVRSRRPRTVLLSSPQPCPSAVSAGS